MGDSFEYLLEKVRLNSSPMGLGTFTNLSYGVMRVSMDADILNADVHTITEVFKGYVAQIKNKPLGAKLTPEYMITNTEMGAIIKFGELLAEAYETIAPFIKSDPNPPRRRQIIGVVK